jgi:1-acyl-sn-glycerol-3-phosphate acyltransferase
MTGAPIVPVAIHGSSKVRNWKRLQFPKVTVRYGDPIIWDRVEDPTREQQQAVAEEIFTAIKALYAELEAEGRKGVARRVRELRRAERSGRKKAAPA